MTSGTDPILAKVYKKGSKALTKVYSSTNLFGSAKKVPQEFKDTSIIHLYKRKENRQNCDNHYGISLLSITGKILARILLNRLNALAASLGRPCCSHARHRLPKKLLFVELQLGKRSHGGHKKRFIDTSENI